MEIVYNLVAYKSKVMHIEDDTLKLSPIRQKRKPPREDNNGSDDSSIFLTDDRHLHETAILDNIDLGSNNITEIIDSSLPSYHISGEKYRIYPGKTDTTTNINITKISVRIESTTILEVTDDKGVINLLINIKCIVIVVDPGFPFQNTSHSTGLDFCETNIRDDKYKTDVATEHYLEQYNSY